MRMAGLVVQANQICAATSRAEVSTPARGSAMASQEPVGHASESLVCADVDTTAVHATAMNSQPGWDDDQYAGLQPLLLLHARREAGTLGNPRTREELVTGYLPLARHLAQRYSRRGVPSEDLNQVAAEGLIKAIDRYDPAHGVGFLPFAIPTIQGEIRRHFRDSTWAMRVPRRIKELHLAVSSATAELTQRLDRAPRPSEIATRLDITIDDVLEALQARTAHTATSLDHHLDAPDAVSDRSSLAAVLGAVDPALENIEVHHTVMPLLARLPARERTILLLRFYANMSQSQIGDRVGLSQMHVSRLLSDTLKRLRYLIDINA